MPNNKYKFLHLAWKIHFAYEKLRNLYADNLMLGKLKRTYQLQHHFLDDFNTGVFWDERFAKCHIDHQMANARERLVIKLLNPSWNVLNIGVGAGSLEEKIYKKYGEKIKYQGCDMATTTLQLVRKRFPFWQFFNFRKNTLPNLSQTYKQVLLLEVLEHIRPDRTLEFLYAVNKLISNNGVLIISVPVNENLSSMLPENPNSHMRVYTEALLTAELAFAGFNVLKVFRFSAFKNHFTIKSCLNKVLNIRDDNNLLLLCKKR